jgi:hypothetical protein
MPTRKTKIAAKPARSRRTAATTDETATGNALVPTALSSECIITDRDKLRALRMSAASEEVSAKAKGDDALAEIRSHKGGSRHILMVNPYDVFFEEGYNPRDFTTPFMRERVAQYAASIAARGVREPLKLYIKSGRLFVDAGETRWRSTMHALNFFNRPIGGVPCTILQGENDAERKIGQWLGNDTLRFDPIAEAVLFRDYEDLGGDIAVFAKRIGLHESYLKQRIRLLEMPNWLQAQVKQGVVKHTTAYEKIWMESGQDNQVAKQLLAGSVTSAEQEGKTMVRPRHVRAAAEGSAVSTRIVRTKFPDRLATIVKQYPTAQWVQWLGQDAASKMFKLANMALTNELSDESC